MNPILAQREHEDLHEHDRDQQTGAECRPVADHRRELIGSGEQRQRQRDADEPEDDSADDRPQDGELRKRSREFHHGPDRDGCNQRERSGDEAEGNGREQLSVLIDRSAARPRLRTWPAALIASADPALGPPSPHVVGRGPVFDRLDLLLPRPVPGVRRPRRLVRRRGRLLRRLDLLHLGGVLQLIGSTCGTPDWWASLVQFVGTVYFNVDTFRAMQDSFDTADVNRVVWRPEAIGSICFLVSG